MQLFKNIFGGIGLYYACILICFYRRRVYLCFRFMFSVPCDIFWNVIHECGCLHFFKICRFFSEFFELSILRFVHIARDRSESPRPIRLSARRVGGRDRNCELCSLSLHTRARTHGDSSSVRFRSNDSGAISRIKKNARSQVRLDIFCQVSCVPICNSSLSRKNIKCR